jgi:hypothetical protein
MDSRTDRHDSETWKTARGIELTKNDQLTTSNEQNLPKRFAQEITSDDKRNPKSPGPSVGFR